MLPFAGYARKMTAAAPNRWTADAIPDLSGLTAVVTGANSGIGYHTTLELARYGATVVMACRDLRKGEAALARMKQELGHRHSCSGGSTLPISRACGRSPWRYVRHIRGWRSWSTMRELWRSPAV